MYLNLSALLGASIIAGSTGTGAQSHQPAMLKPTANQSRVKRSVDHTRKQTSETLRLFRVLDSDADGTVTQVELWLQARAHVARRVKTRFVQLDRDGNGYIAQQEVPTMEAARFKRFDLDADGRVTERELRGLMVYEVARRVNLVFARLDFDGDGKCSRAELGNERTMIAERRAVPPKREAGEAEQVVTRQHARSGYTSTAGIDTAGIDTAGNDTGVPVRHRSF